MHVYLNNVEREDLVTWTVVEVGRIGLDYQMDSKQKNSWF